MLDTLSVTLSTTLFARSPVQLVPRGLLQLAVLVFALALVAAVVGAGGVAGLSMDIAKRFVIVCVVLAVVSLVF